MFKLPVEFVLSVCVRACASDGVCWWADEADDRQPEPIKLRPRVWINTQDFNEDESP